MDKPSNWESVIIELERRSGEEFFLCDFDKNVECKKTNCIRFGGECFLTRNKKYERKQEES